MSQLALLGGPASGKTTYLGALIDGLQSGALPHLQLGRLPSDATALAKLPEALQRGQYPDRTARDTRTPVELPLVTTGDLLPQRSLVLRVADYAGESVNTLFEDRQWTSPWASWAQADAILLFLRIEGALPLLPSPQPLADQARWRALRGEMPPLPTPGRRGLRAALRPSLTDESPQPPLRGPLAPVRVPTALATVDLLQLLRYHRGLAPGVLPAPGQLRLVLAVTAWDAADHAWRERGPNALLAQEHALLEDFLACNFRPDDVLRVGLSSTGVDLSLPEKRAEYLDNPGGEVVWQRPDGELEHSQNLGLPLLWALFGDRALASR